MKISCYVVTFSLQLFDNEWRRRKAAEKEEVESGDKDTPPLRAIYRRSCKDKTKLALLAPLYFMLMIIAAVIAFYSIESLILSYQHKVRTVKYVTVDEYYTIGIALFPQNFAKFDHCEFIYGDDLAPRNKNSSEIHPANQTCRYSFVTFHSRLVNTNRTAMIFHGPTLVKKKQSLGIHFTINTTTRQFSAMEYLLLEDWHYKMHRPLEEQVEYLAEMEYAMPLYTVPAGFRSWIKMSYLIRNDGAGSKNLSDFVINTDFGTYTGWYNNKNGSSNNSAPIYALFEWKTDTYEYVTEILSTTVWNTIGSLAGVFITVVKAGEYCEKLLQRIRRDRRKKRLKLKELEAERQEKMNEYHKRRLAKRLQEESYLKDIIT